MHAGDAESWSMRELLGFDLETTDTNPRTARPVSFAFVRTAADQVLFAQRELVDPGIKIPRGASAVHGITNRIINEQGGSVLDDAVTEIRTTLLASAAGGVPVVGMNIAYDLTIIDTLARQIDGAGLVESGWAGPVVDVLVIDRALDTYRKGPRTLAALAETYDVPITTSHDAYADALASIDVFRAIVRRFPEAFEDLDAAQLHRAQVRWHREWADGYSAWLVSQGRRPLADAQFEWPLVAPGVV
jgi:DNA polymerase III subunit epsilon